MRNTLPYRTSSLGRSQSNSRLYGRDLIRGRRRLSMRCLFIACIIIAPLLAAVASLTCLRQVASSHSSYWNELARYLAGMPIPDTSLLASKTSDLRYQRHAKRMNALWDTIRSVTIDEIVPWRKKNLPEHVHGDAFYPLSGADFINLYTMFPDARRYLMIALEKPGEAATLLDWQSSRLIDGLDPVYRSIHQYSMNNYFASKVMTIEMNNTLLPGTAPSLLIFMARMGLTVHSLENVVISDDGNLVPEIPAEKQAENRIRGIRIAFTDGGSTKRELVYLSMKIGPRSVDTSTPEGKYLNRLHGIRTMMKSAVYLLHHRPFEPVRRFILDRSVLMVQDDSGIPFHSFQDGWEVKLFGRYRPALQLKYCIPVFQPDLKKAYAGLIEPLPFNFGYGILFGKGQSNLMIARKI